MTTAKFAHVSDPVLSTLKEIAPALEEGFGILYEDPGNWGRILIYKETKTFAEGSYDYYTAWWGSDPEESRSWSKLEHHFDRLNHRIDVHGWQLVPREEILHYRAG